MGRATYLDLTHILYSVKLRMSNNCTADGSPKYLVHNLFWRSLGMTGESGISAIQANTKKSQPMQMNEWRSLMLFDGNG